MDIFYVFLLLFTEIILLGIAWVVFKGDFISPSVVTLALFVISTACFAYKTNDWTVVFSFKAYALFSLSFVVMIVTEHWISRHRLILKYRSRINSTRVAGNNDLKYLLYIPKPMDSILFLFFMFCALYYIYRVYKSGIALGATGIFTSIGINKEEGNFDALSRLVYNLTRIVSYVYIVMFANNVFVCKEKVRKNWKSLVLILAAILITFFSGQRSSAICHIFAVIVGIGISLYDARKTGREVNIKKFFKNLVVIAVAVVALFYLSSNIVKGTHVQRKFVDYITYYFGGTTALMGKIVENPNLCHTPFAGYFGEKTFNGFWKDMYSYGIVSEKPTERLWIKMGGSVATRAGNEYTFFCAPYIDFGFIGTLVFVFFFYAVYSCMYYWKIRQKDFSLKKYTSCAIYIWLYAMVATSFYMDLIRSYTRLLNIVYLIYIIVFCKVFLKLKRQEN